VKKTGEPVGEDLKEDAEAVSKVAAKAPKDGKLLAIFLYSLRLW
jgi:hypothetical protein